MEFDQNSSNILAAAVTANSGSTDRDATTGKVQPERRPTFEVALEKAMKLPGSQAREVWRALQLLVNNESLGGQSAAVVSLAKEFDPFPGTWKVLADKALEYEHFHYKR